MDLEVVGRHALLFDDDAMAAFVNSATALVDWNSLSIDRYDVRHLLSAPPPPRTRRLHRHSDDDALETDLDLERYLDLSSQSDEQDLGNEEENVNPNGYKAVAFSYGTTSGSNDQKNTDVESGFIPSFAVPEHLLQHLPPTEKLHQIIARTALFVSKHGGQSEIVLRVKQGDNPTFGFLLPEHNLHPYFRFLVEHKELLRSDIDGKSIEEENKIDSGLDQTGGVGGALSLLGSVYGSGEDEEAATEDALALTEKVSEASAVNADNVTASHGSEEKNSSNVPGKDDILFRPSFPALKERSHVIKRNRSINGVKSVSTEGEKTDGYMDTVSSTVDKLQPSASSKGFKVEQSILEPPADMKRVVDKIVEFIQRNGKEFEAVLVQQDTKHGRFPFLLPSNQFHPYYLNILQKAQESRSAGKNFISAKHDSPGYGRDKKTGSREKDTHSLSSDVPYEPDRKEKFKMVLGKSKKDGQDPPSKANPQPVGVSIDAAAAILQAARKGIKNPNLEILCKTITGTRQVHSSEGGDGQISSRDPSSNNQKPDKNANEADSSEASLTREQNLKAERLKRAKVFAAMVKSKAVAMKSEPLRGLSVEPSESGFSGSDSQAIHLGDQERRSSSVPVDVDSNDKIKKLEMKESAEEHNERRLKRSYRSRSKRVDEEEDDEEESRDHKHSRRKRHHKSHRSKDRHRHRKRHSSPHDLESDKKVDSSSESEVRYSRHRHEHDVSSDDGRGNSRYKHKRDGYIEDGYRHHRRNHRHNSSDDDEPTHSRRTKRSHQRHKHDSSSDEEHSHRAKSVKHGKTTCSERDPDLEEGEILMKSDQSKASECGDGASREASVDLSKSQPEVSDDLRAKIRAMLMATL
ncbi:SWAP (Suppressor-of-White-APricot)/surp domain-containing protein [Euphorbia peplus]|nr:SWAP (Suppressor-of-White-APricot)/surp domain-containing protein [Euphorbia peplus]